MIWIGTNKKANPRVGFLVIPEVCSFLNHEPLSGTAIVLAYFKEVNPIVKFQINLSTGLLESEWMSSKTTWPFNAKMRTVALSWLAWI